MRVDKELSKGSHELILLKLLSRGDKYGYQIIQEMVHYRLPKKLVVICMTSIYAMRNSSSV